MNRVWTIVRVKFFSFDRFWTTSIERFTEGNLILDLPHVNHFARMLALIEYLG
jgi:hypothetical protein